MTVVALCERVEMTRQNYYAQHKERERDEINKEFVVSLVQRERQFQPRIGGKKLYHMLRGEWTKHGVKLGRDRFFDLLRERGLLVVHEPAAARTTMSRHSLPVFGNLIEKVIPSGPHQTWVSDLTYIRTDEGFVYASLITDKMSRKIVGWHIGDSLESVGCQKALDMALEQLPAGFHPIHHSDRGCQYCCHEYVEKLRVRGLKISMTQELHCYENATAERVNGILKQEYGLGGCFRTKLQSFHAFGQAIWLYNEKRPHWSLKLKTPSQVHAMAA